MSSHCIWKSVAHQFYAFNIWNESGKDLYRRRFIVSFSLVFQTCIWEGITRIVVNNNGKNGKPSCGCFFFKHFVVIRIYSNQLSAWTVLKRILVVAFFLLITYKYNLMNEFRKKQSFVWVCLFIFFFIIFFIFFIFNSKEITLYVCIARRDLSCRALCVPMVSTGCGVISPRTIEQNEKKSVFYLCIL